jgi:hypothetical protein
MTAMPSAMKEHYCSLLHESEGKECDLCLAQRRKIEDDAARAANKPTLRHNPFATLLPKALR